MLRYCRASSQLASASAAFENTIDILRKLKQRFGGEVIRDVRFRVG